MDFPIHRLVSDQGVPIYFEEYPDLFRPMSFMLAIMSGGADDLAIGVPGIHHWGEHVPFRGTVANPLGAKQIMGRLSELGGHASAFTSHTQTVYYASAPRSHWREAASIVVDLAARPLCRPEDMDAERRIIAQEIRQGMANIDRRRFYQLRRAVWGSHPQGIKVLGDEQSLAATTPDTMRMMRDRSYGLKRCVVFVAGAMVPSEVVSCVSELLERMPDNDIDERRTAGDYGPPPAWMHGVPDTERTEFSATTVTMLFPAPSLVDLSLFDQHNMLDMLFTSGSLSSPLMRVVREERQLSYDVGTIELASREGGAEGFSAKTSADKADAVVDAFWDVIGLPELRSEERWQFVQARLKANIEMHLPDPSASTRRMLNGITYRGQISTISDSYARVAATPHAKVMEVLDGMTRDKARVVTLLGTN